MCVENRHFPTPVYLTPAEGIPLELSIGARVQKAAMTGLTERRKCFMIGLVF